MQAFEVPLRLSRVVYGLTFGLHGAALVLAVGYFEGGLRLVLCLAVVLSALWAWLGLSARAEHAIVAIVVDAHGAASIGLQNGLALEATLLPSSMVSRCGLVLHWDTGQRRLRHVVLPDMTEADAFRRLKVWARWGQVHDPYGHG